MTKVALVALLYQVIVAVTAPKSLPTYQARSYAEGEVLADVVLLRSDGTKTTLSSLSDGRCQVLVVFNDECQFCRHMAPAWSNRVALMDGTEISWVAVPKDASGPAQFVAEFQLREPWFRLESESEAAALGVYGTPMVVMMGPHGEYLGEVAKNPDSIPAFGECDR